MTARKRKKSVADLAKRRHVRTAQWRLPVGEADVAALVASVSQAELLVRAVELARDSETDDAEKPSRDAQVALARERLVAAQKAVDDASEVVTFREIPEWVRTRTNIEARKAGAEDWRPWAHLAGAEWVTPAGATMRTSDFEGDVADWEALVEPLPAGDLEGLAAALLTCLGRS